MSGCLRVFVALLMAYAVMVILVSPAVPSPVTTVPLRHSVQPLHFDVVLTAMLLAVNSGIPVMLSQHTLLARQAWLATYAPETLDLISVRLC